METTSERKEKYVQAILKAHPIYPSDSFIALNAAKAMRRMPEQVLFYLYLCRGECKLKGI